LIADAGQATNTVITIELVIIALAILEILRACNGAARF
jgi:hypothetical protein